MNKDAVSKFKHNFTPKEKHTYWMVRTFQFDRKLRMDILKNRRCMRL